MIHAEGDRHPRWKLMDGSKVYAFVHPCSICGAAYAPFGVGSAVAYGKPGVWYCREHVPAAAVRS